MNSYTFPFETCEKVRDCIAQPYSAFMNLMSCLIFVYFLLKTKSPYVFCFLFSALLFEGLHTFSHCIHIPGSMQQTIVHYLAIITNISFFTLYYVYAKNHNYLIYLLIFMIFIADIYMFTMNYQFIYTVFTQFIIFMIILSLFYLSFDTSKQHLIVLVILFSILALSFIVNEKMNGKEMLAWWPDFPFHIFIELCGVVIAYYLSITFYDIDV